ncbi:MAG TPA: hypothetical protein VFV87_10525 [Pirellulaceae bacterium]|nr:hypothetical protein [Pirellulaceae bacterium]
MIQPSRILASLVVTLLLSTAGGAETDNAPFDGEWSLEFRVNTRPGGASFTTTQGLAVSPYHFNFRAPIESFRFQDHRRVRLEQREDSTLSIRSTTRISTVTLWDRQNHQGRIHVDGAGSGEAADRRLKLTIHWGLSSGTGFSSDNFGTSQTTRALMSEDGTQITLSNEAGTRTFGFDLWKSTWELKPAAIEKRTVGEDVIEETTTFRGQRNVSITPLDPGGFTPALPVIEAIELKQFRQLKLVPRG